MIRLTADDTRGATVHHDMSVMLFTELVIMILFCHHNGHNRLHHVFCFATTMATTAHIMYCNGTRFECSSTWQAVKCTP